MIRPVLDRVIIKPEKKSLESMSTGGLILLENSEKNYETGKIFGVSKELDLKVGSYAIYLKKSGVEIDYRGENLLILEIKDILAVIEDGDYE
ncbi:MAG: co-chaperone GroES [Fusobacteriaceae bacterium]